MSPAWSPSASSSRTSGMSRRKRMRLGWAGRRSGGGRGAERRCGDPSARCVAVAFVAAIASRVDVNERACAAHRLLAARQRVGLASVATKSAPCADRRGSCVVRRGGVEGCCVGAVGALAVRDRLASRRTEEARRGACALVERCRGGAFVSFFVVVVVSGRRASRGTHGWAGRSSQKRCGAAGRVWSGWERAGEIERIRSPGRWSGAGRREIADRRVGRNGRCQQPAGKRGRTLDPSSVAG